MSAMDFAARSGAQEARDLAEAVVGTADLARSMAAKAEGTAQAALTASDLASKALDASKQDMEAARKAADAASQTAKAADSAAQAAGTTAQAAGTVAQQAEQLAREAVADAPRLFAGMSAARLPATVTVIGSSGFAEIGTGVARYVSDAKATAELARLHPLACFKGDGGRYFRLLPDEQSAITPEQMGCPQHAPGVNAQPYIQAALNYAAAVGVQRVCLPMARYDLWAPTRNPGEDVVTSMSGHYMVVRENIAIVGTGRGKTLLRLLNSQGGTNDVVTQPNMTYSNWPVDSTDLYYRQSRAWMGNGIYVKPNSSAGMDFIRLENIELDGTKTYVPGDRAVETINLTHKGFRVQDVNCSRVEMRNVTMRNFGGEIMYTAGGIGVKEEFFENCVFEGSPQCTINSGTSAKSTYINVEGGNSYQVEILGGWGKTFIGCRFYNLDSFYIAGGAGGGENGFGDALSYSYPMRRPDRAAPFVTFSGTTMEKCGALVVTAFTKGDLYLVDTSLALNPDAGKLCDIDLKVTSVIDVATNLTEAVSISGPENLTTPIGESGINYAAASNIKVDLLCERTEAAKAAGRSWQQAVRVYGRLIDADSVTFTLHGTAARRAADLSGKPVNGFKWPRIVTAPDFAPLHEALGGVPYGAGVFSYLREDQSITPWVGANAVEPQHQGPFTVRIDNSGTGFVDGQVASIYHTSNNGRVVRFPATGAGMKLQQDRCLINKGDRIDLRWDVLVGAWVETGYSTSAELVLTGTAIYDAPAILPGGVTSTRIAVPGAVVGDFVTGLSFGNVDLQGLVARSEVTSDHWVTVWLSNPTSASPDLPSATIRVQVTKGFAA